MELKPYQQRALDALRTFLERAAFESAEVAYRAAATIGGPGAFGGRYAPLPGLPNTPYCCLRLPTGGGKTLLAAHAIGIARDTYLDRRHPVALWLVPSTTIAEQTLGALKTPGHPYRQVLTNAFGGAVRVYGIDERRQIRPQDLADAATVIVSTVQAFRIKNSADRNVYRDDEELVPHFANTGAGLGLAMHEAGPRQGKPVASFANLLHLHRPLMLIDEAHNFTSTLTGETIARLNPAAIVEFTATPTRSNVIVSATAAELKAADMIKLPIHLSQHASWQQAIAHAVRNRAKLAEIAKTDSDGIRPIALYQAQPAREDAEATVDVVRSHLIDVEKIPADRVAVATGTQRELDGIDLFDPACIIEHVITIDALKEGWDCSFAYVFCSLASIRSSGAVEQLLGRVLRMPFATRRSSEELNRAYAHVSEPNFYAAADGLRDRLTAMGFDERTALEAIVEQPVQFDYDDTSIGPLYRQQPAPVLTVRERPDQSGWTPAMVAAVRIAEDKVGVRVVMTADASDEVLRAVAAAVAAPGADPRSSVEGFIVQRHSAASPSAKGVPFIVPQLALDRDGQLELIYPETFVDLAGWTLNGVDTTLPGFAMHETPDTIVFDIAGGRLTERRIDAMLTLALDDATEWDAAALSRFLDRTTRQSDIPQPIYLEYCRRVVTRLIEESDTSLAALVRGKYTLKRAVATRVTELRQQGAKRGVQMLLGDIAPVLALGENAFRFQPGRYEARNRYQPGFVFEKHYYDAIGDLKGEGEEHRCARAIDALPEVRHWVRNVDRSPGAYWLPTSTDKFYPDFVAELADGRTLVIEYKGADRTDNDDSREKKNIGARLEEASAGSLLFLWAEQNNAGDVTQQLRRKIAKS